MSGQNQTQPSLNLSFLTKLKWWQATIMIVLVLLAAGWASEHGAIVSVNVSLEARVEAIENRMDIPVNSTLSAFIKSNSFIVSGLDAGFCLQNGTNGGYLPPFTTNSSLVIQNGLGNASNNGGGSVYVSAAVNAYNASVVLQNNTRLVIECGAKNITYSAGVGAYAIVDDFQNFISIYYSNGLTYTAFNYVTGNLLTQSANMTSINVQQFFLNNQSVTDLFAFPTEAASYIISVSPSNSSIYQLKNCTTGKIDIQDTNCSLVTNRAIGSGYVGVEFREGTFPFTQQFNIQPGLALWGMSQNATVLKPAAGATFNQLIGMDNYSRMDVDNVYVHDLQLDGTGSSVNLGINVTCGRSIYDRLLIHHFSDTGIAVASLTQSGYHTPENYIEDSEIRNNVNYGIEFYGSDSYLVRDVCPWNAKGGIYDNCGWSFVIQCHTYSEGATATGTLIYSNGVTLINCEAETAAGLLRTGFYISSVQFVTMHDCMTFGAQYGVNMGQPSNLTIDGLREYGITTYGIWMNNPVIDVKIVNSVFNSSSDVADIYINSTVTSPVITGNSFITGIVKGPGGSIVNGQVHLNEGFVTDDINAFPITGTPATLGWTGTSGTADDYNGNSMWSSQATLSITTTFTSMSAYLYTYTGYGNVTYAIYNDNGSIGPKTLMGQTYPVNVSTTGQLWNASFSTPLTLTPGTYWMTVFTSIHVHTIYTSGGTNATFWNATETYATFPNPYTGGTAATGKYSIYASGATYPTTLYIPNILASTPTGLVCTPSYSTTFYVSALNSTYDTVILGTPATQNSSLYYHSFLIP